MSKWDDVAESWDHLQGNDGDIYRRRLIYPAVVNELRTAGAKTVLDVGAGNGSLVRLLHTRGIDASGIEVSDRLIGLSHGYGMPSIRAGSRIWKHDATVLKTFGTFDAVTLIFSQQDIGSLEASFAFAMANLRSSGLIVVVGEDYTRLRENPADHTLSRRRWVTKSANEGIQRIEWAGVDGDASIDPHIWSPHSYTASLLANGFTLAHGPKTLPWSAGLPQSYRENARFFIVTARVKE